MDFSRGCGFDLLGSELWFEIGNCAKGKCEIASWSMFVRLKWLVHICR